MQTSSEIRNTGPFNVINKGGKLSIQVRHKHNIKEFIRRASRGYGISRTRTDFFLPQTPEKISAVILTKMKEAYLSKKVTHAVVTCM